MILNMTSINYSFHLYDYLVFGTSLVISIIVGLYYAFCVPQKSLSSYLLGGRQLKPLPVALSLAVTYESSIALLGEPAEVYIHGFLYWISNIGHFLGYILVLRLSVPLFYGLKLTSVYEYFEMRYKSKRIRILAACLGINATVLYMGMVLWGPSTALLSVTEIPEWLTIISLASIAVLYTSLGGISSVVWVDVVQGIIMLSGTISVLIYGTLQVGGAKNVLDINSAGGRLKLMDVDPNPFVRHTLWTLTIGPMVSILNEGFGQSTCQRINSMPSMTDAKKLIIFAIPFFQIIQWMVMAEGLVAYAYFNTIGCDPLASGQIEGPNQLMPYVIVNLFGDIPGLSGLFMAALVSASLSTVSSCLSSTSAVISQDLIKQKYPDISDSKLTMYTKLTVPLIGIVGIGLAFFTGFMKGPLSQIACSILGASGGPLSGLFLMSFFCPWATPIGAYICSFSGLLFSFFFSIGYNFSTGRKITPWLPPNPTHGCSNICTNETDVTPATFTNNSKFTECLRESQIVPSEFEPTGIDLFFSISYKYSSVITTMFTLFVGLFVSFVSSRISPQEKCDKRLMLSFCDQFLCFIPSCFLKKCPSKDTTEGVEMKTKVREEEIDSDEDEDALLKTKT